MTTNTTKYICIKTLLFTNMAHKGDKAFTEGKTYIGRADGIWREDGTELIDNAGNKHTIGATLFNNMFTEVKYHG